MTRHFLPILALLIVTSLVACQNQEEAPRPSVAPLVNDPVPAGGVVKNQTAPPVQATEAKPGSGEEPPAPPLHEDFEGEPKLSLFPRVGDFRPEDDDKKRLPLWTTYIDHLLRTSGVLANRDPAKGHAFGFRGIKAIDSTGFFSPLAVEPDKAYRVSYRLWSKLPPGATTGVGILEYDEFLFIPEQLPRSLSEKHFQKAQVGIKLTDDHDGKVQAFTFRTGPKTRMIHLVFFREGTPDREPVVIDDIDIRSE
jgi:hypothetical protein